MASSSNSKEDKSGKEVANVADDEQRDHSTTVDIPSKIATIRRLHRVLPQVRENKEHLYVPFFFPLGPYHHDKFRFHQAEQLKNEVLKIKLPDEKDKDSARRQFLNRAQEIRNFYGGLKEYTYDDNALAEMMLRDACFVVYYMESCGDEDNFHIERRLGISGSIFLDRDFIMLENQVPLWPIKLLIRMTLPKGDYDNHVEEFLWKFVTFISKGATDREFWDPSVLERVRPRGDGKEEEPLHLLALVRTADVIGWRSNRKKESRNGLFRKIFKTLKRTSCCCRDQETGRSLIPNFPARSVMDLKAKGILIRPSSTCLADIRFKSYGFFGKLLLPTCFITDETKVYFSNVIAFEMSPETETEGEVTSYVNFMQSLIESSKDVKELREKGVLSSFMNDERLMNVFNEIDSYGMNSAIFDEVQKKIDGHCGSKAKTWMAELFHTYFRNPWSAIALFSAAILLCLTFLQTIYSKKSAK